MIKLTTFSILIALASAFALWRTYIGLKRDRIGIRVAVAWVVIWTAMGFFVLFPHLLEAAMRIAQMENRLFFIALVGLLILFGFVSIHSSQLERTRRVLSRSVQEAALVESRLTNRVAALERQLGRPNESTAEAGRNVGKEDPDQRDRTGQEL